MFLPSLDINAQTTVSDIVARDYRTAAVFRKYGIEFCCGGRWPLETACLMKGVELEELNRELQQASRTIHMPATLPFDKWTVDFLVEYITNVHHYYLENTLPELEPLLSHFIEEHQKKYPYLLELQVSFRRLQKEILPHLIEEEETIFPYIRQVARAWKNNDSYGGLLVRTLRKPINSLMDQEHDFFSGIINKWRELTNSYTAPENACVSHRVVLSRLKELDNNMVQHMYLENEILFPRTIQMEKELLRNSS